MQPDIGRIGDALGLGGRINQENWIEQAQVLAKGGETYYATRRARGEAASAAPTPDEGERPAASASRTVPGTGASFDSPPDVAERAAFANRQAAAATSATARTQPSPLPPTVPSAQLDPGCGGADPPRGAGDARQPAAHQRHRRRYRKAADLAGRHALLPDRALVAGRRGALRPAVGRRRTHRTRELDRAGADPEPGRRHQVLAQLRSGGVSSRAPPGQACRRHSRARREDEQRDRRDAAGERGFRRTAIGSLRGLPECRRRPGRTEQAVGRDRTT